MTAESTKPASPTRPASHPPAPRLQRIHKLSRLFRLIARFMLAGIVLVAISVTMPQVQKLINGTGDPETGVVPLTLLIHSYWFVAVWMLERAFNAFARHGVFHPGGARWLKWLGAVFLVTGCVEIVGSVIFLVSSRFHNFMIGSLFGVIGTLLLGSFILMLGWVLEEACELREQQELTI